MLSSIHESTQRKSTQRKEQRDTQRDLLAANTNLKMCRLQFAGPKMYVKAEHVQLVVVIRGLLLHGACAHYYVVYARLAHVQVQATCVPSGCAEPLIWACQQRSTNPTPTEVFECFREICRARVRGGQFTPVACTDPADTRSQLSIANMTYFNYATAKINATDSRNPFLVNAFPGMPSTAMEYCTAVYG